MCYRFIADSMLGKLGRWMIFLGYDVEYFRGQEDEELIRLAKEQNRIIITRDTHLAMERFSKKSFLVSSIHFENQLKQIVQNFPMDFSTSFLTRCPNCNVPADPVEKLAVLDQLPEKVKKWATEFRGCPSCGKLFWDGTHVLSIKKYLKEIIGIEL